MMRPKFMYTVAGVTLCASGLLWQLVSTAYAGQQHAPNTNTEACYPNHNSNTNKNTNLNANVNSNMNTNANMNANVNSNVNLNTNVNTNTNTNQPVNTNTNTNTNTPIEVILPPTPPEEGAPPQPPIEQPVPEPVEPTPPEESTPTPVPTPAPVPEPIVQPEPPFAAPPAPEPTPPPEIQPPAPIEEIEIPATGESGQRDIGPVEEVPQEETPVILPPVSEEIQPIILADTGINLWLPAISGVILSGFGLMVSRKKKNH